MMSRAVSLDRLMPPPRDELEMCAGRIHSHPKVGGIGSGNP